jgi:hypothetical protein
MQLVKMEGVQYFGADITPITAEKNNECFKSDARHFHVIDWSCKIPPPVDLILLRDVLFHFLSTSVNLDILRHINQSGSKYLLTTTFGQFEDKRGAADTYTSEGVGYRNINIYNAPYNFPKPLTQVWEKQAKRWIDLIGPWTRNPTATLQLLSEACLWLSSHPSCHAPFHCL